MGIQHRKLRLDPDVWRSRAFWMLKQQDQKIYYELLYKFQHYQIGEKRFRMTFPELKKITGIHASVFRHSLERLDEHGFIDKTTRRGWEGNLYQISDRWREISDEEHEAIRKRWIRRKKQKKLEKISDKEKSIAGIGELHRKLRQPYADPFPR